MKELKRKIRKASFRLPWKRVWFQKKCHLEWQKLGNTMSHGAPAYYADQPN